MPSGSAAPKPWVALVFSSAGHAYMHLLTAYFAVVVLALERDWGLPYDQLIALWTLGSLLVGACALPAGWLADRWSAPGMLVTMFLGMGLACFACAASDSPLALMWSLAALGAFAAIYHPVGIPWLVRSAPAGGKALGFNNVFGSLGVAAAGLISGTLVALSGWRLAFAVPGAISIATGIAMLAALRLGALPTAASGDGAEDENSSAAGRLRVFAVLLFTMFAMGFVYQTSQTAFPKLFELRLQNLIGGSTLGVGGTITVVYGISAALQLLGGHLADRYNLKWIYLGSFLLQAMLLALIAGASGAPLLAYATFAVFAGTGALPAENLLLARFSPPHRHGLVFGMKFVLSFGAAPLAVSYVAFFSGSGPGLGWVFGGLALLSAAAMAAALTLPLGAGQRREVRPAPAEGV